MLENLLEKTRSYRRFYNNIPIEMKTLRSLVGMTRLLPSAMNLQPIRFLLSNTPEMNNQIFPHLSWPQFEDWSEPRPEERPSAYVVIVGDTHIASHFGIEAGIAAQTILMGAVEQGLGGCMLARLDLQGLHNDLHIPLDYKILLVVALGTPAESVQLEDMQSRDDYKIWRDAAGVHHVPKRQLENLIIQFSE